MKLKKIELGNTTIIFAVALTMVSLSSHLLAHHSVSEYDQTQLVEVEGVILQKLWRNPHVMLQVAVNEGGEEVIWSLEGDSVSSNSRSGFTGEQIAVGDSIKAAGFASRLRDANMIVIHVLAPGDQEIILRRGSTGPRWPDAHQVSAVGGIDPDKAEQASADGLFRVWTSQRSREPGGLWFFRAADTFPLTEAALDKYATFDEFTDNPQLDCTAPGMPAIVGNPYPMEFSQLDANTLMMSFEEFDVRRTIHLNQTRNSDITHSPLGYSTGNWEDENTLVVETTHINYPYLTRVGVSQSEEVTIREIFRVIEAEGRTELHHEMTVTDPWGLTEPFVANGHWAWVPGEEVGSFDCSVETN